MIISTTFDDISILAAPPIVSNISTKGTAGVGQTYTLVCSVLSGLEGLNAVVSYQWTKDNGTGSQLGTHSNILSFPSLRLSDAGSYTCEINVSSSRLLKQAIIRTSIQVKVSSKTIIVSNISLIGIDTPIFFRTVTQPTIDLISSAPNPVLSGSSPTLLCIVELHPAVDIPVNLNSVWISPDGSTLMSNLATKSFSLYMSKVVLSDVSLADGGQYTCKVSIGSEAIVSDVSVSAQREVHIG